MIRVVGRYAALALVLKGLLATSYSLEQSIQQISNGLGRDLYVEMSASPNGDVWKQKSYTFEPTCLEIAFVKNWWADFSNITRHLLEGPDMRFKCSGRTKIRAIP